MFETRAVNGTLQYREWRFSDGPIRVAVAGWEQRAPEGEPNEELYLFIYEFMIGDSTFAPEALEPEDALDAGYLYCIIHEGWIDTLGIDLAVTNTMQSMEMIQIQYKRVRSEHAFLIAIAAAGGLCSRDVMRSTADSFEQAADSG